MTGRDAAAQNHRRMTNQIALAIGLLILAVIGLDLAANDGTGLMFTARKFLELVEWVAFWR